MARAVIQTPVSYDFKILAIVSTHRDFKLCWLLNKELYLNLIRHDDLTMPDRQPQFSRFSYRDSLDKIIYHLISNKSGSDVLVPELRAHDYFLLIKGYCSNERFEEIHGGLRVMAGVQAAFPIEPKSLASIHNLIIDDAEF